MVQPLVASEAALVQNRVIGSLAHKVFTQLGEAISKSKVEHCLSVSILRIDVGSISKQELGHSLVSILSADMQQSVSRGALSAVINHVCEIVVEAIRKFLQLSEVAMTTERRHFFKVCLHFRLQ